VLWQFLHPDDVNPLHAALSAAILQAPGQRIVSRLRSLQHPTGYLTVDVAMRFGPQGVVFFMRPEQAALVGLVGGGPAQAMHVGQQPQVPPAAPLAYAALAQQQQQHQPLQQAAYLRAPPPPSPAPSTSSSSSSPSCGNGPSVVMSVGLCGLDEQE